MKDYRHFIGIVAGLVVAFLLWQLFDLVAMPMILGVIVFIIVVLFLGIDADGEDEDWYI